MEAEGGVGQREMKGIHLPIELLPVAFAEFLGGGRGGHGCDVGGACGVWCVRA